MGDDFVSVLAGLRGATMSEANRERVTKLLSLIAAIGLCVTAVHAAENEIRDVTFISVGEHFGKGPLSFEFDGKPMGKERNGYLAALKEIEKLPRGTSLVWGPNYDRCGACAGGEQDISNVYPDLWKRLTEIVSKRGLLFSSTYPGPHARRAEFYYKRAVGLPDESDPFEESQKGEGLRESQKTAGRKRVLISWSNFRGANTPADEVLYFENGRFVGRGAEGFQKILAALHELPKKSEVVIPRYQYSGRWAVESFSPEELDNENQALRDVVPYAAQRESFDKAVALRQLTVHYDERSPSYSPWRLSWDSGDRYGSTFVSHGRIVRHDEKPAPAAVALGWTSFNPAKMGGGRKSESNASYTLDGKDVGKGASGFAEALKKISELPKGSVINVRACIRTRGPFSCPLIFKGHRHFERTGFEPYFGMFPWLIDVAEKRELKIQWIPDEQESCRDCELNL